MRPFSRHRKGSMHLAVPAYHQPVAYDAKLADRLRRLLADEPELTERAMFGGLVFLVRGNMAVCTGPAGDLMVRVDPAEAEQLVATSAAEPIEMRGSRMRGWVGVNGAVARTDEELARWVARGLAAVSSLPDKPPKRRASSTR